MRRVLLAGILLAACHDPSDPDKMRVIGLIEPTRSSPPVLEAPAAAPPGRRFTVIVHTVGSSQCTQPDGGDVSVVGSLIRIVPYDIWPKPGHTDVCPEDYVPLRHPLAVTAPAAGLARIRVVGRRPAGLSVVLDSVERPLMVQP